MAYIEDAFQRRYRDGVGGGEEDCDGGAVTHGEDDKTLVRHGPIPGILGVVVFPIYFKGWVICCGC